MAQLKPVPGQILLTKDDFDTLRDAARKELGGGGSSEAYAQARNVILASMAALNQQRCGDPAGVIRRSSAGSIAVREQNADGTLRWNVTYLDDADINKTSVDEIKRWDTIHAESWLRRLTVGDYPEDDAK